MARRYVENVTIMADLNEDVTLPTELVCLENDFNYSKVTVDYWEDGDGNKVTKPPTDKETELIYEGTINGYVHKVYCSVVVGTISENPQSAFPNSIDQFGLPKRDVQTSDIPDIDDYQYFKAKTSRTSVEQYQLEQLTEALASRIIIARDVNHIRNAVIEVEKYCKTLGDRIDILEKKVNDLESKVKDIQDNIVIQAENVGSGQGIYHDNVATTPFGRKLQFKTLKAGEGIEITENGEEVNIKSNVQIPDISMDNCGKGEFVADSYKVCKQDNGYIKFSDYMGIKFIDSLTNKSMLFLLGVGDSESDMTNAGRIFKGQRNLVFEMKTIGGYSGIDIAGDTGKVTIYENDGGSHIDAIVGAGVGSVYHSNIKMDSPAVVPLL